MRGWGKIGIGGGGGGRGGGGQNGSGGVGKESRRGRQTFFTQMSPPTHGLPRLQRRFLIRILFFSECPRMALLYGR